MKQRLLSIVAALSLMVSTAVAQTISFSDFEARPGRNKTVEFSVLGVNEMTALQFNLSLPEGFSLSEDGEGENLNVGGVKTGHEMKVVPLENGDYLIVLYNMYLNTFKETLSFSMTLKASEDSGIKEGRIYNVRMSTVDAQSKALSDVKFSAVVGEEEQLVGGEFVINGIKYNGDAETRTASVIGVEEGFAATEVIIPETANGFIVTTIGDRLFANNKTITSVSLPNTVKSIEEKAFRGCTNLQSVSLGSSLETIGNDAFRLCENLASIDFPNSVYEIGEFAFYKCVSLRSVVLPTSLKAIRNSLFFQCSNLESVEIPNSVEVIEENAFGYCESLKSITIPSSVVSIIPENGTEIYMQFAECSQLESIVVEEGNSVYDSRNNANAIIETNTNTLIIGCNNSTVPEGVERIGDYAFSDFKGLEDVTLPSTLKEIGVMAFSRSGLKSIEIPASIENLGESAFNKCESLRKAVLPNTLTSIPASLFIFCKSLEEVNIPNGVESIGDMAFRRCGFSAIEIPTSVKTIGEQAFQGCVNMETITIPSSVTSISEKAFQNCDVLHTVVSKIETPFAIESNVFSRVIDGTETPTTATLYVPEGCKELYKSTEGWNQFATVLEEGETADPDIAVSNISLTPTLVALTEGESLTLVATVSPDDATDKTVIWTSSDEVVVTVENGVITAVAPGVATITATAGSYSATCVVTVEKKVVAVSGIALDQTAATLTEGETLTLKATVSPDDATDKTVTWSSSNVAVATVENGVVTAVAPGTATITATAGEHSATCVVTVEKKVIAVSGIALDQTAATLTEGETLTLKATVSPADATDKTVTWTTSDATVATVENGVVTAVAAGTATITAKAGDKTATCVVTVEKKAPEITYANIADGDYYLKNVGSGKYLTGANSWGTQASLGEHGINVTLERLPNGKYTIDTHISNSATDHYLGSNGYVDAAQAEWIITEPKSGTYALTLDGANYWGYDGSSTVLSSTLTDATHKDAQWQLVTRAELEAALSKATLTKGVDATFYIKGHSLSRNHDENRAWQGDPVWGGPAENMNAEKWNTTPVDIYQELSGLRNGYYVLSVQAFYRDHENPTVTAERRAAGTEQLRAQLYAGEHRVALKSILDGATAEQLHGGLLTSYGWVPNSMDETATYFAQGYYVNTLDVWVSDGTLRIGIRKETGENADWLIFDNFRLTYYGTQKPAGIDPSTLNPQSSTEIYDIMGRRVLTTDNLKGGIYIVNGKKVVLK